MCYALPPTTAVFYDGNLSYIRTANAFEKKCISLFDEMGMCTIFRGNILFFFSISHSTIITQDDKMTILAQLFWLAVSLLESDYEHEFLLACRLLARVLHRLPLDRPDARDKVEKLQQQLKWGGYPGVHALLLKVR